MRLNTLFRRARTRPAVQPRAAQRCDDRRSRLTADPWAPGARAQAFIQDLARAGQGGTGDRDRASREGVSAENSDGTKPTVRSLPAVACRGCVAPVARQAPPHPDSSSEPGGWVESGL